MKTLKCQIAGLVLVTGLIAAALSSCTKETISPKPVVNNVGGQMDAPPDTTGNGLSGGEDGTKLPPN